MLNNKYIVSILTSLMLILLTGCTTIASTIQYEKGTECLEKEDYPGAVKYLERAVELDPDLSKYHTNLTVAYLGVGDIEKAWFHARQSVMTKGQNDLSMFHFMNLYKFCVEKKGLNTMGTPQDAVLCQLGIPDILVEYETKKKEAIVVLIYGCCSMKFCNGKLEECSISSNGD